MSPITSMNLLDRKGRARLGVYGVPLALSFSHRSTPPKCPVQWPRRGSHRRGSYAMRMCHSPDLKRCHAPDYSCEGEGIPSLLFCKGPPPASRARRGIRARRTRGLGRRSAGGQLGCRPHLRRASRSSGECTGSGRIVRRLGRRLVRRPPGRSARPGPPPRSLFNFPVTSTGRSARPGPPLEWGTPTWRL